jgi:hypothetical protein
VQERAERVARDADHHDERRERSERVGIVGRAELAPADEGVPEAQAFEHRRGHGEPEQREPRDARQDEHRAERRKGQVDEDRDRDRRARRRPLVHQPAGPHESRHEDRRERPVDEHLHTRRLPHAQLVRDR